MEKGKAKRKEKKGDEHTIFIIATDITVQKRKIKRRIVRRKEIW